MLQPLAVSKVRPFCLAVDQQCSVQFLLANDSAALLQRSDLARRGQTPSALIVSS